MVAGHGVNGHGVLTCEVTRQRGAVVVRPTGTLDVRTHGRLRDILLKCVADQPSAVIVDLGRLTIAHDSLASVFVTVWMRTAQWSTVPLVIVPGPMNEPRFEYSPIRRFLRFRPTVTAALKHLDDPSPCQRTVLWLPTSAQSLAAARGFVTETCHNWDVPDLAANAATVAVELVANAGRHIAAPARLRLELRQARLTVAVADDDPRLVRWPAPTTEPTAPDGGLGLVVSLAYAWGCSSLWSGGKVVWAVLVSNDQRPVHMSAKQAGRTSSPRQCPRLQ